jgi:signal transduction histidine kinase
MMRSLTLKLALAFLIVSIIGAALAAVLARWSTFTEFGSLVLDQAQSEFVADAATYYQANGSWAGVMGHFPPRGLAPSSQPPPGRDRLGQPPAGPPPPSADADNIRTQTPSFAFALVDQDGYVVVPGGPYRVGDYVPAEELPRGVGVEVDGQVVGKVLTAGEPPELTPPEELFLTRINQALLYAALGATLIALPLGLLLARTLTRPLRELTAASRSMAQGDLEQSVTVRSHDELGELALAFNQMSAELARANQARRQMTADIAHDLRTPLTVIKGYAEALRDEDLPPTTATFDTIYREAEHLSHLIEDLRTLSLVDAGELALNCRLASPRDLLERTTAAYLPQARGLGIALHVDAAPDLPPVHIDPERLAQVLGNLVGNALRHTPEGGRITLAARQHAGSIHLTVQDTGTGIAPPTCRMSSTGSIAAMLPAKPTRANPGWGWRLPNRWSRPRVVRSPSPARGARALRLLSPCQASLTQPQIDWIDKKEPARKTYMSGPAYSSFPARFSTLAKATSVALFAALFHHKGRLAALRAEISAGEQRKFLRLVFPFGQPGQRFGAGQPDVLGQHLGHRVGQAHHSLRTKAGRAPTADAAHLADDVLGSFKSTQRRRQAQNQADEAA